MLGIFCSIGFLLIGCFVSNLSIETRLCFFAISALYYIGYKIGVGFNIKVKNNTTQEE